MVHDTTYTSGDRRHQSQFVSPSPRSFFDSVFPDWPRSTSSCAPARSFRSVRTLSLREGIGAARLLPLPLISRVCPDLGTGSPSSPGSVGDVKAAKLGVGSA